MQIFGPVPSRRLGMSIGINNIPAKVCSYACLYCQVGRTSELSVERQSFFHPEELMSELKNKIAAAEKNGLQIDYLTIVADGEPTLDINLGRLLDLFKQFKIKTAVITNSTLLNRADVRADLMKADWVSVKIDTVNEELWRKVNCPLKSISLPEILQGIKQFALEYQGVLCTETMLLNNINDTAESISETAQFVKSINPSTAYIAVPVRPPADSRAQIPVEGSINIAYQIFADHDLNTELLTGYEGNSFASTGNASNDLLAILAVHPMREDAVKAFLSQAGSEFGIIDKLVADNKIITTDYNGHRFYLRKMNGLVQ